MLDLETLRAKIIADGSQFKTAIVESAKLVRQFEATLKGPLAQAMREQKQLQIQAASASGVSAAQLGTLTKAAKAHTDAILKQAAAHKALAAAQSASTAADLRAASASSSRSLARATGSVLGTAAGTAMRYGRRLALGAGGVAAASIYASAKFDDLLTRSIAVAGGASDRLRKQLEDNAKSIAQKSITSAHQVAGAYLEMSQAGYSLAESMAYVKDIQRFSVAANLDMSRSVELLSQTTRALGLNGPKAMKDVADAVAKAANMTTASIADLTTAMSNKSAAAARVLGKDLKELTAVLSAYAASGIKGERAGEFLNMTWRDLQSASLKHAATWKAMGITVYDTNGIMLHTADILGQLERAMASLAPQQRKGMLLALGMQDRSQASTMQLLGMSGAIREYERQLKDASGESDRLAKTIEGSLLSSLRNTWQNVVVLGIEIGDHLAPFVRLANKYIVEMTQSFSRLLSHVSDRNAFKIFTNEMTRAMKVAGEILGTFTTYAQNTFVPEMANIGRDLGRELGKGFWQGFSNSAVDWQAKLDHALKNKKNFEAFTPKSEYQRKMKDRIIAESDAAIKEAQGHLASKTPTGPTLLDSLNNIMRREYGNVLRRPSSAGIPSPPMAFGSAMSFAGRSTRPDVLGGSRGPVDVKAALESLSPESVAAEKEAAKITKHSETEAARIQKALEHEAERLHDSLRKPEERVKDEIDRAKELVAKGLLSAQDLTRLKDKLYAELDKDTKHHTRSSHSGITSLIDPASAGLRISGMTMLASTLAAKAARLDAAKNVAAVVPKAPGRFIRMPYRDELPKARMPRGGPMDLADIPSMSSGVPLPHLVSAGPPAKTEGAIDKLTATLDRNNELLKTNNDEMSKGEKLVLTPANFN